MRRARCNLALCLLLIGAALVASSWAPLGVVQAQGGGFSIRESRAEPDFPEGIRFTLVAEARSAPQRVELLFRVAGDDTLNLALPETEFADGRVHAEEMIDLQAEFLPAGLDLRYFWRVHLTDGGWTDSPEQSVRWLDTRFVWRPLESAQVVLYIHDLSDGFGREILASAQDTVDELEATFGLTLPAPLIVWVYSNTEALLGAQQTNFQESLAGVAFPEYGLITAAVPEGNTRELGRVIPHEVAHLVLNQVAASPFGLPPLWLDEGLAVYYQGGGKENFPRAVQRALAEDRLFALSSLAASFPLDPEGAYLAYAQSLSAVTFLLERYGVSGMARFVEQIGAGLTADEAMTAALGIDLPTFERAWHEAVRAQGRQTAPPLAPHSLHASSEAA